MCSEFPHRVSSPIYKDGISPAGSRTGQRSRIKVPSQERVSWERKVWGSGLVGEDLRELLEPALHFSKIQCVRALNQPEMAVTLDGGREAEARLEPGEAHFQTLKHFLCGEGAGLEDSHSSWLESPET